jgi:hypothetical protein
VADEQLKPRDEYLPTRGGIGFVPPAGVPADAVTTIEPDEKGEYKEQRHRFC